MAEFREYSTKYPFRMRSETPDIAVELSLQPWRAFGTDGVIMFSDILTPLPALGIEFDVIKGKGPLISTPVRSMEDVRALKPMDDPSSSLSFVGEILSTLRTEVAGGYKGDAEDVPALLGFVGTPWTLAAYAMEAKADRHLLQTKQIMMHNPEVLHAFLDHLTEALITYCEYQVKSGAQIVQLFDSWAHHLSPAQFEEFSQPYAERVVAGLRERCPGVPIIFHANGGVGKLPLLMQSEADVVGLDWNTSMAEARAAAGPDRTLQGNVDPMVLFGPQEKIKAEVDACLKAGGGRRHILGVGHGVVQGTPEENVGYFVQLARESAHVLA